MWDEGGEIMGFGKLNIVEIGRTLMLNFYVKEGQFTVLVIFGKKNRKSREI